MYIITSLYKQVHKTVDLTVGMVDTIISNESDTVFLGIIDLTMLAAVANKT